MKNLITSIVLILALNGYSAKSQSIFHNTETSFQAPFGKNFTGTSVTCFNPIAPDSITNGPFIINTPFKKSTYNGVELRSMKHKELKQILLEVNDPVINKKMKAHSAKSAVSTTLMIIGNIVMAAGLVSTSTSGEGSAALVAGGGIILLSALVGIGNKGLLKASMLRYNEVRSSSVSFQLDVQPAINNTAFGKTSYGVSLVHKF